MCRSVYAAGFAIFEFKSKWTNQLNWFKFKNCKPCCAGFRLDFSHSNWKLIWSYFKESIKFECTAILEFQLENPNYTIPAQNITIAKLLWRLGISLSSCFPFHIKLHQCQIILLGLGGKFPKMFMPTRLFFLHKHALQCRSENCILLVSSVLINRWKEIPKSSLFKCR